jgi:fibronectin-binding autotransporter adhesin
VIAVAGIQSDLSLHAAITFIGADTTNAKDWYDAGNWADNGKIPSLGNNNAVIFDDAGDANLSGVTISLGHNESALSLALGNTGTGQGLSQSFTIASPLNSNTLTLTPGTASPYESGLITDSTANETISCEIILGDSQAWVLNNAAGTLLVSGQVTDGGAGYGISKQSTGTLVLTGTNTFSGQYIARGGTTIVGNDQALGTAPSVIVSFPSTSSSASLLTSTDTLAQNIIVQSNVNTAGAGSSSLQYGATLGNAPAQSASAWTGQVAVNQPILLTGGAGTVTFSGNVVDGTGNTGTLNGATDTYTFVSSNLTISGGTVVLAGASNTYSGSTTVQAGTLLVTGNNLGSGAGRGPYLVQSGATLAGNGTITTGAGSAGVEIANGGTLSPGTSTPGTFSVSGDVTLDGTLAVRVGDAGTDVLSLTGVLNINSDATLNLTVATPLTAPAYVLADYSTLAGTFSNISNQPGGYSLNYDYNGDDEIALVSDTPEPASLAVLALPAALMIRRRRSGVSR